MRLSVIVKPRRRKGPGPLGAARPQEEKKNLFVTKKKKQLMLKTRRQTLSGSQVNTHRVAWFQEDCVYVMMAILKLRLYTVLWDKTSAVA